ncbi:MAG: Flp pilus assembly complex ATPase component TadA [Flavobacteriales bacterium]|nr:Flp pilus assembly complex ATPase component TadA [Flavobacteriales bacterium]
MKINLFSVSGGSNDSFFHRISSTDSLESYTINKDPTIASHLAKELDLTVLFFEQSVIAIDSFSFDHNLSTVNDFLKRITSLKIAKVFVLDGELLQNYIRANVTSLETGHTEITETEASKQFQALMYRAHELGAQDTFIHLSNEDDTAYATFKVDGELSDETYALKNYSFGRAIVASVYDGKKGAGTQIGSFDEVTSPQEKNVGHVVTDEAGNILEKYEYRFTKTVTKAPGELLINLRSQGKAKQLSELGLPPEQVEAYKSIVFDLSKSGGMSLICGQTGSGKSTTNYACLLALPRMRNVQTFEDPIEISKPREYRNITQNSLNHSIGAMKQLSSIMRQAPDCLFLQEVRDKETARFATSIALTGHGVVTSIHAKTPFGIVQRLEDLGVERSTLSSPEVLKALSSQVLVKTLCPHCSLSFKDLTHEEQLKHEQELRALKCFTSKEIRFKNPEGCAHCNKGEKGRKPILELLKITDDDLGFIINKDYLGWKKFRLSKGHKTIYDQGVLLFKSGCICLSRLKELPTND